MLSYLLLRLAGDPGSAKRPPCLNLKVLSYLLLPESAAGDIEKIMSQLKGIELPLATAVSGFAPGGFLASQLKGIELPLATPPGFGPWTCFCCLNLKVLSYLLLRVDRVPGVVGLCGLNLKVLSYLLLRPGRASIH